MRRLLLLALLTLPAQAADLGGLDWDQHPGAHLPFEAPLADAGGQPTTLRQVAAGRPLVLAPGYFHCPNLCGVVRDDLFAALEASGLRAGQDYTAALLTIDPAETADDATAAREALLARHPAIEPNPLTGPAASLAAVAGAAGFHARYDPATKQFLHPAGLVLATPDGRVSGYLLGVGYAPDELAAAIARARDGLSAPAEPIHLFCFTYDPATGRFSVAIMQALRLAALLTVAGIAGVLVRLARA